MNKRQTVGKSTKVIVGLGLIIIDPSHESRQPLGGRLIPLLSQFSRLLVSPSLKRSVEPITQQPTVIPISKSIAGVEQKMQLAS